MQPNNNSLSPGFITVDEAVEIIKSDTRENPVVDMDLIVHKLVWIETGHNFRIPRIKMLPPEKVYKTKRGNIKDYETIGEINVYIRTNFEKELLKKTILDKFRELVGHEYEEASIRARSTVADDAQGREAVRPRNNRPIAKEGAVIGEGTTMTSNGENLQV